MDRETAALELKERAEQKQRELSKLRDEIAMRAMVCLMQESWKFIGVDSGKPLEKSYKLVSDHAYQLADAFLEARKR